MSKDNNTDAQTAFDIDESKVFQACCCSFLGFYWPEPGGMGCFGCTAEGDFLCLGILELSNRCYVCGTKIQYDGTALSFVFFSSFLTLSCTQP